MGAMPAAAGQRDATSCTSGGISPYFSSASSKRRADSAIGCCFHSSPKVFTALAMSSACFGLRLLSQSTSLRWPRPACAA